MKKAFKTIGKVTWIWLLIVVILATQPVWHYHFNLSSVQLCTSYFVAIGFTACVIVYAFSMYKLLNDEM